LAEFKKSETFKTNLQKYFYKIRNENSLINLLEDNIKKRITTVQIIPRLIIIIQKQ